jgi:hypothetical protein
MGSHVALVKGNRQMGFQVDRATHIFFSFGLMRSPDGISCWFWLKGIAGRDLRLAQPRRFWFWFKEIARWDLRTKGKKKKGFSLQSLLCKTLRSFAS